MSVPQGDGVRPERPRRAQRTQARARRELLAGDPTMLFRGRIRFPGRRRVVVNLVRLVTAAVADGDRLVLMGAVSRDVSPTLHVSAMLVTVHCRQQPAAHQVGHESDAGDPAIHGIARGNGEGRSLSALRTTDRKVRR